MYKLTTIAILSLFIVNVISCTDALNSSQDNLSDIEIMDPMTSALISIENNEVHGNGIFSMNWSSLNPRFSNENDELGMALAIGFDKEVLLKPPYDTPTVEMGSVSIESARGESIKLTKQKSRFSGEHIIYSHRSFGPFTKQASLSYDAGSQYSISTSGSDVFPALHLTTTTPNKQVSILSPSDEILENHSGEIELSWDAVAGKPVAIHIRPSFDPKAGEKPGSFNRDHSKMILLEEQNGTYTITGQTLSEISERSAAKTLHISVGQLYVNDFQTDGKTYRVIMRSADHRLVKLN